MRSLLELKANIVATMLIAILSAITTILAYELVVRDLIAARSHTPAISLSATAPTAPIALEPTVLDCDKGVYSPIQKTCVSQTVFDLEMKRLFSALGIDATPYQSSQ